MLKVGWLQGPYVGIAILAATLLQAGGIGPVLLGLLALPVFVARSGLLAFQRTDEAYDRLVRSFVTAIEVKDLYTRGHSERVATLSVHVAEQLGVPYDERRLTGYAALLHDVGKIGVPLCVINKPGPLDDDEFALIKQHPAIGAEILRDIDFLAPVLDIVRFHHERLDGGGYPHGIGEEELDDLVRIVTTVDAFDAMTSTRSYRRAFRWTARSRSSAAAPGVSSTAGWSRPSRSWSSGSSGSRPSSSRRRPSSTVTTIPVAGPVSHHVGQRRGGRVTPPAAAQAGAGPCRASSRSAIGSRRLDARRADPSSPSPPTTSSSSWPRSRSPSCCRSAHRVVGRSRPRPPSSRWVR